MFSKQPIIPVSNNMKDFEKLINNNYYQYIILLNVHVSQLHSIIKNAHKNHKKIFLHTDLIYGLKNNEYGIDFLCHNIQPDGLISTKPNLIKAAKKKSMFTILRLFLFDFISLDTGYKVLKQSCPDFVEVMPGVMPRIIHQIKRETDIPVLASGMIQSNEEVKQALSAGAEAVTTTEKDLWTDL